MRTLDHLGIAGFPCCLRVALKQSARTDHQAVPDRLARPSVDRIAPTKLEPGEFCRVNHFQRPIWCSAPLGRDALEELGVNPSQALLVSALFDLGTDPRSPLLARSFDIRKSIDIEGYQRWKPQYCLDHQPVRIIIIQISRQLKVSRALQNNSLRDVKPRVAQDAASRYWHLASAVARREPCEA